MKRYVLMQYIPHMMGTGVVGVHDLVKKALKKEKLAIAKVISAIEKDTDKASAILSQLWAREPRSHVIGVTGSAGVGKSTLISAIASELVKLGHSVAILALDPSSPFSGGALLGDRVRMRSVPSQVFIRSMSTSEEESIPWKALLAIEVLEGIGFDYILVETPGAGQFNVRIMKASDTVIVVLMPGAGDDIQAIKAGIMEIGHIYIVNKADTPGAQVTQAQIEFAVKGTEREGWQPKVILTAAVMKKGIGDLVKAIQEREKHLNTNPNLRQQKRHLRRALEIELILMNEIMRNLEITINTNKEAQQIYEKAIKGEINAVTAAKQLMKTIANQITTTTTKSKAK